MAAQEFPEVFGRSPEDWAEWIAWLQLGLHGRSRWRLPLVLAGLLLARGRRTVSSWLRAGQLQADYIDYLNLWMHTLVELWAWRRPAAGIRNRSDSPWDAPNRRPSHADRRKALRHAWFQNEFSAALAKHKIPRQITKLLNHLARLAT